MNDPAIWKVPPFPPDRTRKRYAPGSVIVADSSSVPSLPFRSRSLDPSGSILAILVHQLQREVAGALHRHRQHSGRLGRHRVLGGPLAHLALRRRAHRQRGGSLGGHRCGQSGDETER